MDNNRETAQGDIFNLWLIGVSGNTRYVLSHRLKPILAPGDCEQMKNGF